MPQDEDVAHPLERQGAYVAIWFTIGAVFVGSKGTWRPVFASGAGRA